MSAPNKGLANLQPTDKASPALGTIRHKIEYSPVIPPTTSTDHGHINRARTYLSVAAGS